MRVSRALLLLGVWAVISLAQSEGNTDNFPDKIEIGVLENIFEPVHFDHKLHADMTVMGQGCNTCHHHGSGGVFEPCATCHVLEEDNASMDMPTLNGAYHRNCLNCHQSWTTDELCETCHVQKKFRFNLRKKLDATDLLTHHHKEIVVPEVFHFVSPESDQKPVSFQHKQHVDLYRFKCETCHRQTDCSTCHAYTPDPPNEIKSLSVHHQPCSNCHDTATSGTCGDCHRSTPSQGFSHAKTGWELNRFHKSLACNLCHTGTEPITALDPTCTNCHSNFVLDEFDHERTGLRLNEDHVEFDCYECHTDERFDIKPTCIECHDEDINFPNNIPGEIIQLHSK